MAKKQKSLDKLNETGNRKSDDRRKKGQPVSSDRRKKNRRRQIDPTTCERDYSDPEIEFMQALDQYKRDNGRMFPTCSEILEVVKSLGYQKVGVCQADEPHGDSNELESDMDESLDSLEELTQS